MTDKSRRRIFAVAAVVLGFAVALGALEASLRATATAYSAMVRTPPETFQDGDDIKILCVGDSYTFGTGADGPDSYPDQLQRRLAPVVAPRSVKVINWGLPAQNSSEALLAVKSFYEDEPIPPDVLIVAIGVNDYWNHHLSVALSAQGNPLAELDSAMHGSRVFRLAKIMLGRGPIRAGKFYAKPNPEEAKDANLTSFRDNHSELFAAALTRNLSAMAELAKTHGTRMILLGYPDNGPDVDNAYAAVSDRYDIPLVVTRGFGRPAKEREALLSEDGWHPNAKGYTYVVDQVTPVVRKVLSPN